MRQIGLWTLLLFSAAGWAAGPDGPGEPLAALTAEHFRLHTDAADVETAQETLEDLNRLWEYYVQTLGAVVTLRESTSRLDVYSFTGPEPLERFMAGVARDEIDVVYPGLPKSLARGFLAVDSSGLLARSDLAIVFHDTAHLIHGLMLYEDGVVGSWWVREGLAAYFMQTRFDRDEQFRPGEIRTSEGYVSDISPDGRAASDLNIALEPKRELRAVRERYKAGSHIPLETLLEQPGNKPWASAALEEQAVVESWVLVHFLLHGADWELRQRMARYLELERSGKGGREAFRKTVAGDLAKFERLLYKYAKKMR
jgi:hypothetical protein